MLKCWNYVVHMPDGPHVLVGTQLPEAVEVHIRGLPEDISGAGCKEDSKVYDLSPKLKDYRPALRAGSKYI